MNTSTLENLTRPERRRIQWELKKQQKRKGKPFSYTLPNRKSDLKTTAEEKELMQQTAEETLSVYLQLLPGLLEKLSRIPDPRNPNKVKHKMTLIILYGILMFVYQIPSRRKANQELTTPHLLQNLKAVFPEIEDMPHQSTLCRLLEKMDVDSIETAYTELLKQNIRKKRFKNLLRKNRYLVAVDGTQKYFMGECWNERYLRRAVRGKDGEYHYYAYVLEAVLIFANGMVLPLMSEFLENSPELETIENNETWKQDCELKAFYRLAKRLKKTFPKLPVTLLLDGLYANGPVMEVCRKNKWHFMIVLKDGSLPSVWQEVNGLMRLDTRGEQRQEQKWQGRKQIFKWVNEIEYSYGEIPRQKKMLVHVVSCDESWEVTDKTGSTVTSTSRHAWLSSQPINRNNVHELCNLSARKRWLHENNILKEKRQGYHYEHIFSSDWNGMRGYHYLMHIARMLNELMLHSVSLTGKVRKMGFQPFIKKFREIMANRELDTKSLSRLIESPGQLRLVQDENWKTSHPAV